MPWLRATRDGFSLTVRAVPRASATEIAGVTGDSLRIRVQAPPADGKANAALVKFLAAKLGVRRGDITIAAGRSARTKRVQVRGVSVEAARSVLR